MRTKQRAFTRDEMRLGILALLTAAALAIFGFVIQDMIGPSMGGMDSHQTEPPPGVMDATPLAG